MIVSFCINEHPWPIFYRWLRSYNREEEEIFDRTFPDLFIVKQKIYLMRTYLNFNKNNKKDGWS
jgi:hypothetical protein